MIINLQGLRLLSFFISESRKLVNFRIKGQNLVVYLLLSYYNSLDK